MNRKFLFLFGRVRWHCLEQALKKKFNGHKMCLIQVFDMKLCYYYSVCFNNELFAGGWRKMSQSKAAPSLDKHYKTIMQWP